MIPKFVGDHAVCQCLAQQVPGGVFSYIHESDVTDIAAATLVTDLDIASIKQWPTTIYLAGNVWVVELLHPLLVLFIQQTLDPITRTNDDTSLPILFLLDEFRQL